MARQKSTLVALKALEKEYEEQRRALLRKAEEEMSARVHEIVGDLANIAKDFPKVVSAAIETLLHAAPTPSAGKTAMREVIFRTGEAPTPPASAGAATNDTPSHGQEAGRFRAMGVKAHRTKLGLGADDYGKLVGVSGQTIYHWESGKGKPRESQKVRWLAIRSLGKREALERLDTAASKQTALVPSVKAVAAKPVAPKPTKRGQIRQTAEEMILSLLKGKTALTTTQLNAAWKKAGRRGDAANTLSIMTKDGKLKRAKLKEGRGSEYSVA